MKNRYYKIPSPFEGDLVERQESCRICNEKSGKQIAVIDYWDIKTARIVQCEKCKHIQLDPMLNDEETSVGCYAYYIEEILRTDKKERVKNCVRNFRRGVVFGYSLKSKKICPESVLELGPGSGYFSAGLQFVFPHAEIIVMDINRNVLRFNQEHHNFKVIEAVPDNSIAGCSNRFDLVIARDLIEHVADISKVLTNVTWYLVPGGYFHFITPNGHEDVWKHYLTTKFTSSASELLINHVNYFDGKGLKNLLIQKGLNPVDYYTYTLKTTLRGNGWKKSRKLMSPISKKRDADLLIKEKAGEISTMEVKKKEILNKWYIQQKARWMTRLYSIYKHSPIFRISPELNIGHEIYGLYQKTGQDE